MLKNTFQSSTLKKWTIIGHSSSCQLLKQYTPLFIKDGGKFFSTHQSPLRDEAPSPEQKTTNTRTAFESKQDKRLKELEERLMKGKAGVLITNKREKEIVVSGVILTFALFFFSLLFTFYRVYDTYLQKQIRYLPTPFVKLEEDQIDCIDFFGHHYYYMPRQQLSLEEIEELEKKSIR